MHLTIPYNQLTTFSIREVWFQPTWDFMMTPSHTVVYEYYDSFDESLTGKIIISKPTNSININEGSASPECADNKFMSMILLQHMIDVGEEVTWQEPWIRYTHTVTSGTPGDGPDGLFDSGSH